MRHTKIGKDTAALSFDSSVTAPVVKTRLEGTEDYFENYALPVVGGLRLSNVATASLPAAPPEGTMLWDSTTEQICVWTGSAYWYLGSSRTGESYFEGIAIQDQNGTYNADTDEGSIFYAGGDSSTGGAGFRLYGQSHSTNANDWEFFADGYSTPNIELLYDHSESTFDFSGNTIVVEGGIKPYGTAGPIWTSGNGTPESTLTADVGSLYTDIGGGAGTTLYVKESGTGNTGWVAK